MTETKTNINQKLSSLLNTGIYRFEDSNVVFMDPVRLHNLSYSHFRVSSSSYYSRFFEQNPSGENQPRVLQNQRKRKRRAKKPRALNEREQAADDRHQIAKPLLMKAHECLLGDNDILMSLGELRSDDESTICDSRVVVAKDEQSFIEIGSVWQAKLIEICLYVHPDYRPKTGFLSDQSFEKRNVLAFESLVANETNSDMEADFLDQKYIMPRQSSFYMLEKVQFLLLCHSYTYESSSHPFAVKDCGFKLIVIDPPWENSSASQKLKYPTLPNRYFLSLPIPKLAHTDGALVALWVTNKEKLRIFVEKELFPKWGVKYMATHYWLKVKADGSLIGELDLFHHRPYECVVLGYYFAKDEDSGCSSKLKFIPDGQVIISIPGDYSRKPPIGELLQEYIPGSKPGHCIELFARELLAGWTSWGNEPLRFQDLRYFSRTDQ